MNRPDNRILTTLRPRDIVNPATQVPPPKVAHDPLDVGRRLDELKGLEDGWADGMQVASDWGSGFGKAPDSDGLDWLKCQFKSHFPQGFAKTYMFPTPEGRVQAEWPIVPNEASLEIDLETHSGDWHCINVDTDESYEKVLDLNTAGAWDWVVGQISDLGTRAG